uniref:Pyridoxamine 5'-phosphate oxidase-related, FMN-binding protein n=1 Tax=Mycobacterium sp. (strain MCS) TaxID=164756 RepID=A0A5Q5BHD0_MYCSS
MNVTFARVEKALRQQTFGTLSTLTDHGAPHATGVVYAVSAPGEPLDLYVTTRTTTRKVRNLRAHPEVAFVVPVPHRFLPAFPPRAIQFLGTATIVAADDKGGNRAFDGSWFLRRILATERRIVTEGGDLCFIRVRPNGTVFTYAMGMSVWDNLRQPRGAIGRVTIPEARR